MYIVTFYIECFIKPNEVGCLRSLQELYIDENSLEKLPDAMLQCTRLEQLDLTSNRLFQLPEDVGDLSNLADLTASHNCIRELPSSIGFFNFYLNIFNFCIY